jgi:hypothetical protein
MAVRKPLVNINGVASELPIGDQLGGVAPAIAPGQAATFEQLGSNALAAYEGGSRYEIWPGTTNTIVTNGGTALTVGTIAAGALAATNFLTQSRRVTMSNGATAGVMVSIRTNPLICWRGNSPGRGGFRYVYRWATEVLVAGNRIFVGLTDSTATPTNVDPLTISYAAAKVGLAANLNSGNYQLVNNAVGAAPTVLDLGTNFPVNQTDVPELILTALPNAAGFDYIINNKSTGATTSGTLTTNIPGSTVFLGPTAWMTNNATAKLTTPN